MKSSLLFEGEKPSESSEGFSLFSGDFGQICVFRGEILPRTFRDNSLYGHLSPSLILLISTRISLSPLQTM